MLGSDPQEANAEHYLGKTNSLFKKIANVGGFLISRRQAVETALDVFIVLAILMATAINIETAMTLYHLFVAASFLTGILSLLLSFIVYLRSPKSQVHRKWSLTTFFVGVWSFALFLVIIPNSYANAFTAQLILNSAAAFIPALYYDFILDFLQKRDLSWSRRYLYMIAASIVLTNFFGNAILDMQPFQGFSHWIVPGPTYLLLPLLFSIVFIAVVYLLLDSLKQSAGFQKKQIAAVLMATLIGFGSGMTNFLPHLIGVYPFGNFFTWVYVVVISFLLFKEN